MTKEQQKAVVRAVEEMRKSEFGVTGIKVEFEAKFGRNARGEDDPCHECEEGRQDCDCCEGEGTHYCDRCDGDGNVSCDDCDGEGEVEVSHPDSLEDTTEECTTCDGEGTVSCSDCEGSGMYECDECDENGTQACEHCDGNWQGDGDGNPFINVMYCHDWLLGKLAEVGLAEQSNEGYVVRRNGPYGVDEQRYASRWKPKYPIAFSKVYPDGTVDTEWTITINLDKPKNILVLPKLIEAWNAMGAEINRICETQTDVSNAGMHMALLQGKDAVFPLRDPTRQWITAQQRKFENFRKSMTLLMPALYFLGSPDEHSRPLGYRKPTVSAPEFGYENKYCAVHYCHGALEFRVFETCYNNPDTILDNVMVMRNCLRYWRRTYKRHYLDTITKETRFGFDRGNELKRFYITSQHIDLLNRGLKLLKPSYLSITDVKKQRKFTLTKRDTKDLDKKWRLEAETAYIQYEKRFGWEVALVRDNFIRRHMENYAYTSDPNIPTPEEIMPTLTEQAEQEGERHKLSKTPKQVFCEQKVQELNQKGVGEFRLAV